MLMLDALRRLHVDVGSYKTDVLRLRGHLVNIPAMIELSTKMLVKHLSTLSTNVKTLFP
jgi:hypothetical protein